MVRVLLVVLLSSPAAAQTRWGLTWRAPDGCIGPGDLAQGVEEKLGRSLFAKDPQYRVEGNLARGTATRWKARFTLVSAAGEVLGTRELTADDADCRALDQRLTLAVALTIEPELQRPLAVPTPAPSPAPAARAPLAMTQATSFEPVFAPRGSALVHIDSDSKEVRLLRYAGTSYGTGYSSRGPVTVSINSFADECRAPCDEQILKTDDRFHIGGSGVVMSSEFVLADFAKRGRVNLSVKAGDAGVYGGGMVALIGGLTACVGGLSLAVAGAITSGSSFGSRSGEGFVVGGVVTLLAGAALAVLGGVVMGNNRTEVTFDDGTVVR
jgi:hypothetical protein